MFANILVKYFEAGGPVMWPILIVSIIGLTVVIERIFWWTGRWFRRDPKRIEKEAREQFHYARPGEVIYVAPERPAPTPPANRSANK